MEPLAWADQVVVVLLVWADLAVVLLVWADLAVALLAWVVLVEHLAWADQVVVLLAWADLAAAAALVVDVMAKKAAVVVCRVACPECLGWAAQVGALQVQPGLT